MKIGFDAKRAAQNRTGLGNYSRFTIRILSEQLPDEEYHLYVPKPHRMPYLNEIPTLNKLHLHFPPKGIWSKLCSLWRVWGMTNDVINDAIDIFHGLSNELPLNIGTPEQRKTKYGDNRCKYVVTVHDLIFLHSPQYYHLIDRKIYDYKFRKACRTADRVIAVSEFTKQEIIKYYHTPADKIDVVYQGCDPVFASEIPEETVAAVKRNYSLPEKFLLYVGSIEERKNLMLVAKSMNAIKGKSKDIHVVAVGKRTPYVDEIQKYLSKNGLTTIFHFYHNVPYTHLPSFYKLATAFVYPSRIEGFGIPMLEAITSGVPAIGCKGSCLEEAGGQHSIYVDCDDEAAMGDAILRVCNDTALREDMIRLGKEYAQKFSEDILCKELLKVYGKL